MLPSFLVWLANLGQALVPVLSMVAYWPQWRKIIRERSSGSISLVSWGIWTVSSAVALFYAVVQVLLTGQGWALVFSTTLGLVFVIATLVLSIQFRPRPGEAERAA